MVDNLQQSFLNKSRQDKFLMVLSLPKALLKQNPEITIRELQISIFESPVPKVTIPSIDTPYQGQYLKVTSQSRANYGPLTVGFTIDNDFKNYWILWAWLNILNEQRDSKMSQYFDKYSQVSGSTPSSKTIINKDQGTSVYFDYMTNVTIYGLDEYNNKKIQFDYINTFITDLSEIQYSYRNTEELQSTVTFAFNQMYAKLLVGC
jgi:hypothetical protein